ncbi:Small ribosomal subunit biogenesis GTPase RsgA 1 mitochondrial [Bienertia sinuspersici]
MAVTSFSLLRHHAPPHLTPSTTAFLLLRRKFSLLTTTIFSRKFDDKNSHALKVSARAKHTHSYSLSSLPQTLSPNQAIGMVASAQANFMRVIVQQHHHDEDEEQASTPSEPSRGFENIPEGTGIELLCVVRAVLKKIKRRVLVGDKVLVGSIDWVDRRGMIENVFPRESEIPDPPIANADHYLVVFSMDQPKVEPFLLTRFLVEAESARIPLTLALNKCELVRDEVLIQWKTRLRQWGYIPIFCSAESKRGLDSLMFYLRDRTTVIVGPSGVGKSSLINALRSDGQSHTVVDEGSLFDPISGSKWFEEQRVGEVSTRSGRGKHTTRNVSLLPLTGGGYLADTPGFNQPSLLKVTKHTLAQAFPEIQKRLDNEPKGCAFNNCLHVGEPGCVVTGDWERYPYYFQLLDEIRIREEFQLRTMGTKRESDVRNKVGDLGVTLSEPRLEPKKHRRQSRKKVNQSLLDELEELDEDEDEDDLEDNPIIRAMENENQ